MKYQTDEFEILSKCDWRWDLCHVIYVASL